MVVVATDSPSKDHPKIRSPMTVINFYASLQLPSSYAFPGFYAMPFGLWFDLWQTDELIDYCEGPQKQQPLEKPLENQWQVQ